MRRFLMRGVWIMGLFFTPFVPAMAVEAVGYPKGLEFLADINPPKYLTASGYMTTMDSEGEMVMESPIQFYWEAENERFALDMRISGGGVGVYILGVADTIWIRDFVHHINATAFRDQSLISFIGMPLSAEDLLAMFNILPRDLEIDTFYQMDSLVVVKRGGVLYSFDAENKRITNIKRGETNLTLKGFLRNKEGDWPTRIEINQPIFTFIAGVASARITINTISLKRQRKDNPFTDKPRSLD
jgi:hypothetical protein